MAATFRQKATDRFLRTQREPNDASAPCACERPRWRRGPSLLCPATKALAANNCAGFQTSPFDAREAGSQAIVQERARQINPPERNQNALHPIRHKGSIRQSQASRRHFERIYESPQFGRRSSNQNSAESMRRTSKHRVRYDRREQADMVSARE